MLLELLEVPEPIELLVALALDVSEHIHELSLRPVVVLAVNAAAALPLDGEWHALFGRRHQCLAVLELLTVQFRQVRITDAFGLICALQNHSRMPFRIHGSVFVELDQLLTLL